MSVEQKIAQLLAESKKLEQQAEEVVVEEVEELDETAASETIKTKAPAAGGGDNPDNAKNAPAKKPEAGTSKDNSKSGQGGNGGTPSGLPVKDPATYKAPVVDVKEDVAALVDGEDLSEEFKEKAATIFEAAVVSRIKTEIVKIQEQYDAQLVEEFVKIKEEIVEKVDGYLGYVVEQWMKNNELALESGIKSELAESFIEGMKRVFQEHYVDIPAEKYDVLGALEEEVGELESKLNESVNANIEMSKQIAEMQRAGIIADLSEGLTVTESEKFEALAEDIVCEDVATYTKKLQTIRESYFKHAAPVAKTEVSSEPAAEEQMISESVAQYAAAFAKLSK
jgi:hypothetical protein